MKPKFRQHLYTVGTIATAVLTILAALKIIDPSQFGSLSTALTAFLGLFGVTAAGTAAVVTSKQQKEGWFEDVDPAEAVVNGVNAVIEAKAKAQAEADRVAEAISGLTKDVPVLGPLSQQILDQIRR